MKNLFFLLLLSLPYSMLGQTTQYGSFKIMETEIIYQKVFNQDSITADKLVEFLKTLPTVANIQSSNGTVTADLVYLAVDFKKFKFAQVSVPPIIQTGKFNGKLAFEIKPGKYRVTLRGIQLKGDMGYKKITEPENMTNYACVDSGTALSKEWCKPNTLGLLEMQINDRFTYRDVNTDWK